jgi:hypothetical protein
VTRGDKILLRHPTTRLETVPSLRLRADTMADIDPVPNWPMLNPGFVDEIGGRLGHRVVTTRGKL